MIDLRSDTVTKPCAGMRRAMAEAEVGDDVIGFDPTVDRLQQRVAEMLGKEAAIFMPSGTMTNQIAIRIHCKPGDEFLCEEKCHIFNYEQAAFAQLSGVAARTVRGDHGVLRLDDLRGLVRPINEHMVRTRLVCLEITHNTGGGRVAPIDEVRRIGSWARDNGLAMHLDGARLFNAEQSSGVDVRDWSEPFDTVSVCFSKGLGAPIGSALAGSKDAIREARFHRKLFGGGMRQVGVLAAAVLYALEHNRQRLAEDHVKAQVLADAVRQSDGLTLTPEQIDSNIVLFRVAAELGDAASIVERLKDAGVAVYAMGTDLVRAVTHLDVSLDQARQAARAIEQSALTASR